ncbi:hypothetical protein C461_13173 [Halorubrum aidingense JCM 13560]|uniref:Rhodanese domain-containing protein n=1 Tax=Halorubrum aidingense JCM 13560 TaxID=1230454 RepID=M0PBD1_9EURY|nr:rhodanese-like domain-containing protein [Halorubrum aidingense]EMA66125.1 hypothetical protein C461_13173 [Halorubrum aidingense JCM 13560]
MGAPLSPSAVRDAIDSSDPVAILDVRQSLDYVNGNVMESTWVPRGDLERRLPALVPNRSTPIVLCDERGERAALDARWIESLGYDRVDYLDGGIAAWRDAGLDLVEAVDGVHATAFGYESKEFGERVEVSRDLPKMDPNEVAERRAAVTVVDVRNPPEYDRYGTIPGSINVEGVDLALYADELRDDEPLVVHCAGRTRSIIGAATLQALGIEDVYELENGTMGWELAGRELEAGPGRPDSVDVDADRYRRLRSSVEELLQGSNASYLSPTELAASRAEADDGRTTYLFDVRTEPEFETGHVPGARSVAGGQLIQTAGQHIAVRDAAVVLVSETHVRSSITAYWLAEMGYPNVHVLRGGTSAWEDAGSGLVEGPETTEPIGSDRVAAAVTTVSPDDLADLLDADRATVLDVDARDSFTDGHVPGAAWAPRSEIESAIAAEQEDGGTLADGGTLVLACESGEVSALAAAQLEHCRDSIERRGDEARQGVSSVSADVTVLVLEGGVAAWRDSGRDVETGDGRAVIEPREAVRKPYAQGTRAMKRYLEWEENLVE